MLRRILLTLTLLFAFVAPAVESANIVEPLAVQRDRQTRIVYITRTGERYHRGDCRYLRQSKIPIKLKDAIAEGYSPCKVCRP